MSEKSVYETHGYRGVLLDIVYKAYLGSNITHQIDDITYILFDKFYLTQWVKRSPFIKPKYTKRQAKEKLFENLQAISQKLKKREYDIKEERHDLHDACADIDSMKIIYSSKLIAHDLKTALPRFLI